MTNSRRLLRSAVLMLLLGAVGVCERGLSADDQRATDVVDSAEARKLALRAHAEAAAIDDLPRFFIRASAGTFADGKIEEPPQDALENLFRALEQPAREDWFRFVPTFAWDENHFVLGIKAETFSQDFWGTRESAGERGQGRDSSVRHVLRADAAAMWKDRSVSQPNYLLATRHKFWWGDNGHRDQHFGSGVPPSHSTYRHRGTEEFDGEVCEVVESPTRQERLWISQSTGLMRGFLQSKYVGPSDTFSVPAAVVTIAGRPFESRQEYAEWYASTFEDLPSDEKWQLTAAWSEARDFDNAVPFMLVRFRDFREVAPGIWWPHREDRSQGSVRNNVFDYIRTEYIVGEVRTDVDLTETVNGFRPREGERVQDQRYAVPVNYEYRADRTETEILEMVDAEYQKRLEGQEVLNRLKEPIEKMIGQPAPPLPEEGWVGGLRPDLAGRPYLVHFWATWCGPCKNDFPLLQRMAEQGAALIGLHPAGTPEEEVARLIEESKLGYPTFVAPKGNDPSGQQAIAGYSVGIFPYCILVDADGKVAAHGSLRENDSELLRKFRDLQAQSRKSAAEE